MTIKKLIIKILRNPRTKKTCMQIVNKLNADKITTERVKYFKSCTVSGRLRELVLEGVLRYADEKSPRGGHVYQKNKINATQRH